MNKIALITKREYITRVRKKSFIIMTILGPILMACLFVLPIWLISKNEDQEQNIAVIDKTGHFSDVIEETDYLKINFIENQSIEDIQKEAKEGDYYAVLLIPENYLNEGITLFSYKQVSLDISNYLQETIENEVENINLKELNIDIQEIEEAKIPIDVQTYTWTKKGDSEKSYTEISMAIGFIAALIIYMFIFIYGAQVMRGVMEEKTSRIVEIIVSSVKPFQLMMGKIFGVALVALTQFFIWIIFTLILTIAAKPFLNPDSMPGTDNQMIENVYQLLYNGYYNILIKIPQEFLYLNP